MRRFVPPAPTTAPTAGIVYWSLVTVLRRLGLFGGLRRSCSGCWRLFPGGVPK